MWVVVCAFACDPLLTHGSRQLRVVPLHHVIFSGRPKKQTSIGGFESSLTNSARERAEAPKRSINNNTWKEEKKRKSEKGLPLPWKCFPHKRERGEKKNHIVEEYSERGG